MVIAKCDPYVCGDFFTGPASQTYVNFADGLIETRERGVFVCGYFVTRF